ncbi:MAG: hypothetical protein DHS20C11_36150 [Lysobacteraceae bacterium]|nr:MAG: hypothetical protein DHS20C11_36150 [Xanthomonadaceae bacterium]
MSRTQDLSLARPLAFLLAMSATVSLHAEPTTFFERMASFCGMTFSGHEVPVGGNPARFEGQVMTATVASCEPNELRMPFVIGDDHSRTWVLTQSDDGALTLKHDHRHEDGTPDEVTNYGGTAKQPGNSWQVSFPADAFTAELIPEAAGNVWTLILDPKTGGLTYDLKRDGKDRFRATLYQSH